MVWLTVTLVSSRLGSEGSTPSRHSSFFLAICHWFFPVWHGAVFIFIGGKYFTDLSCWGYPMNGLQRQNQSYHSIDDIPSGLNITAVLVSYFY